MKNNKIKTSSDTEKLTHFLTLNTSEMSDLGVLDGRMKAILFFFNEARTKKSEIYRDFAIELLEELFDILSTTNVSSDFKSGLCGIGWGIEYLIANRYIDSQDDVCKNFDEKIKQYFSQKRYSGIGLDYGLLGILLYLTFRLENKRRSCVLQEEHLYTALISKILTELQHETNAISNILQETDNRNFDNRMLIIYSKWEFPLLMWCIGKCAANNVSKRKAAQQLLYMLNLLNESTLPKSSININLLLFVLRFLFELNITAITKKINSLYQIFQIENTDITPETTNKFSFNFNI